MANGNSIVLVGNVTRDPELRFTPSGQATASFGLAVNRRWQNRQTQEWEEATSFFDIVCWREMAENAAESLGRGIAGARLGPPRAEVLGDARRRSPVEGGGHCRRDWSEPPVGDRAGDQERAQRPRRGTRPVAIGRRKQRRKQRQRAAP